VLSLSHSEEAADSEVRLRVRWRFDRSGGRALEDVRSGWSACSSGAGGAQMDASSGRDASEEEKREREKGDGGLSYEGRKRSENRTRFLPLARPARFDQLRHRP
jgi:hypothetical protein